MASSFPNYPWLDFSTPSMVYDKKNIQNCANLFNRLPRIPFENDWIISIRHSDVDPPGDFLMIINSRGYTWQQGPARELILDLTDPKKQADLIIPLLIGAFNKGMGATIYHPMALPFAPWSWCTHDAKLARALGEQLKALDIKKGLCKVGVATAEQIQASDKGWADWYALHVLWYGCMNCKKTPEKLRTCAGCKKVRFCSQTCQKEDWQTHKKKCKKIQATTKTIDESTGPKEYYELAARMKPDTREFINKLGLVWAWSPCVGLRRLILTGKDTQENFVKLFGPTFKCTPFLRFWKRERLEALLNPPPGSLLSAQAKAWTLDAYLPSRSPRPATNMENFNVWKVQQIQRVVRGYMGARVLTSMDMRDLRMVVHLVFEKYGDLAIEEKEDELESWVLRVALFELDQGTERPREFLGLTGYWGPERRMS